MNFIDAYKAMRDGKRVMAENWFKGCFIKILDKMIIDEDDEKYLPNEDYIKDNWFIYNDSPAKDKMIDIDGKLFSLSTIKEALKNHIK